MFVLQISNFNQGELLFFALIIFALMYVAIELRSLATMGVTTLTVITLVGVFQGAIELAEFWIMLIIVFIVVSVSMAASVNR